MAASVIRVTVIAPAVEAVVMCIITYLVISVTVGRDVTLSVILTETGVVTDLARVTVSVLQALARVVCQVTDGGGVLAVVIRGAASGEYSQL